MTHDKHKVKVTHQGHADDLSDLRQNIVTWQWVTWQVAAPSQSFIWVQGCISSLLINQILVVKVKICSTKQISATVELNMLATILVMPYTKFKSIHMLLYCLLKYFQSRFKLVLSYISAEMNLFKYYNNFCDTLRILTERSFIMN